MQSLPVPVVLHRGSSSMRRTTIPYGGLHPTAARNHIPARITRYHTVNTQDPARQARKVSCILPCCRVCWFAGSARHDLGAFRAADLAGLGSPQLLINGIPKVRTLQVSNGRSRTSSVCCCWSRRRPSPPLHQDHVPSKTTAVFVISFFFFAWQNTGPNPIMECKLRPEEYVMMGVTSLIHQQNGTSISRPPRPAAARPRAPCLPMGHGWARLTHHHLVRSHAAPAFHIISILHQPEEVVIA